MGKASPAAFSSGAMCRRCQRALPAITILMIISTAITLVAGGVSASATRQSSGKGGRGGEPAIREFSLKTAEHSDCDRVTFQLSLPELSLLVEAGKDTGDLVERASTAVSALVRASEPLVGRYAFDVAVDLLDDSSDGEVLLDVNIDFDETSVGGTFAAGIIHSEAKVAATLAGPNALGQPVELANPVCKYMDTSVHNSEGSPTDGDLDLALLTGSLSQELIDIVHFTAALFKRADVSDEKVVIERYGASLHQLLNSLGLRTQPQVVVQQFEGSGEGAYLELPTRVTFRSDSAGAQLLHSVINLWGTALRNRAASIGVIPALESDSVLTTTVRAVATQPHDLARVRFTLQLSDYTHPVSTEEDIAVLRQELVSFYHSALPSANIGTPYSVDLLWAESKGESIVEVGMGVQFLDHPNAANMLALSLSTNSSLIDRHAPDDLGPLVYSDVSGHHSLSVLRFTAHLGGQNISEKSSGDLEATRLQYVMGLRALAEALGGLPLSSVRVLHLGDSCARLPTTRCGASLMVDTFVGVADDAAGLHLLFRAITRGDWHDFVAGLDNPLLEVLQFAEFTHVAGGGMMPSTRGSGSTPPSPTAVPFAGVSFSTVLLDHGGLTAGIELKYSEWGKGFMEGYKSALRSVARETGLGPLASVEVLRIEGKSHPVVHTYVTLPSSVSASRLSAALQKGDGGLLSTRLEPVIGKSRFVDVSGTHMARQVRFTAVLADMAEAHFEGFQDEYVAGLQAVVEDGGAIVAPEVSVLHAELTESGAWAVDTALLFLDDRRAADDFVQAASALVPRALASSLGRVGVSELSGNLEAQHVSFSAALLDFYEADLRGAALVKAGLFYRLLFQHWLAEQQEDGFRRVIEPTVEILHLDVKGQPSVTARVVLIDDARLAGRVASSLQHRNDGRATLTLGATPRNSPPVLRREMREELGDSIKDLDEASSDASFYGFYGSDYSEQVSEIAKRGAFKKSRHRRHRSHRHSSSDTASLFVAGDNAIKASEFYGFSAADSSASSPRGMNNGPARVTAGRGGLGNIVGGGGTANNLAGPEPLPDRRPSGGGGTLMNARSTNMTVDFTAVLEEKHISDLASSDVKMQEVVEDFKAAIRTALQDLGLAPAPPTSVYVTDATGERRLLQLDPSSDEPAPELLVKRVYGRYDGVGVDARLVFIGTNAATFGLQFIEMMTTRPQVFYPAFRDLGAVRFLFGHDEAGQQRPNSLDDDDDIVPSVEESELPTVVNERDSSPSTPPAAVVVSELPNRAPPAAVVSSPIPESQHCRNKDKHGECCASPHALDASFECCRLAVDECGVCGGDASTCAVSAVVRIMVPYSEQVVDKRSKEFAKLATDFKEGLGVLLGSWGVNPALGIQVDRTMSDFRDLGIAKYRGTVELDLPFTIYPHDGMPVVPNLRAMRTVLMTAASERAEYKELVMAAVVDVYRQGVCGNNVCELGEMTNPLQAHSNPGRCVADCRRLTCPVGTVRNIVGQAFVECSAKGSCDIAAGACVCATGYAGANCGECATGYVVSGRNCVPMVDPLINGDNSVGNDIPTTTSSTSSPVVTGSVIAIASICVFLVILIAVAGVYVVVTHKKKRRAEQTDGSLLASGSDPASPTIAKSRPAERSLLRSVLCGVKSTGRQQSEHQQYLDSITGCQRRGGEQLETGEVRLEITPDIPRSMAQEAAMREATAVARVLAQQDDEGGGAVKRSTGEVLREAAAHMDAQRWRTTSSRASTRASEDHAAQPVEIDARPSPLGAGATPSLPSRNHHHLSRGNSSVNSSSPYASSASPAPLPAVMRRTTSSSGTALSGSPPSSPLPPRQKMQPSADLPLPPRGITLPGDDYY